MDEYFNKFQTKKYKEKSLVKRRLLKKYLKAVEQELIKLRPRKVLEMGCGEGFVIGYLWKKHPNIEFIGMDKDLNQLENLKRLFPGIKTCHHDILAQKQMNEKYDLVMILEVLEHIPEVEKALLNIRDFTDKYILISVPREPVFRLLNFLRGRNLKRLGNDPGHVHTWSKNGIVKLVRKYYRVVDVKTSLPWTIVLAKK